MPRENTAMSAEEIAAFLSGLEWVALGTLDPQGAPDCDVAAALFQDGRLYLSVGPKSEANLTRDNRSCCSADVFPSYYEIRGVTLHGRAEPAQDAPAALLAALRATARANGLPVGPVYALPLSEDCFGFDFGKIQRRM